MQKSGKSVTSYAKDIKSLIKRIALAANAITNSKNPKLNAQMTSVLTFQPNTTLSQAIEYAQRLESDKARLQQFQPVSPSLIAATQPNLKQLITVAVQKTLAEDKAKRQACYLANQNNGQLHPPLTCYNCKEIGHISKNCPKSQQASNTQSLVTTTITTVDIQPNTWTAEEDPELAAYPAERKTR